jgi:hypothetical protein
VRVSFALPYRCTFGQHLCLVGSVQRLGSWDVRQGVAMSWSEGDICAPAPVSNPSTCAQAEKKQASWALL